MQLEPKHIAPYLPYKLRVYNKIHNTDGFIANGAGYFDGYCEPYWTVDRVIYKLHNYKPLLRPMSDLYKPCLEGGKTPIVELFKLLGGLSFIRLDKLCCGNIGFTMSYETTSLEKGFKVETEYYLSFTCKTGHIESSITRYEYDKNDILESTFSRPMFTPNQLLVHNFLDENHYDWRYDLIDKGLAIDINRLNKEEE